MDKEKLTNLLHHLDGQLGLAIYRTIDDQWMRDSEELRTRIKVAIEWLEDQQEVGDEYTRGYNDGKQWTAEHLIRVADTIRGRADG